MKSRNLYFGLILLLLIISGCKDITNPTTKRNITGRAGELLVVVSKENWESETGKYIHA